MPERLPLIRITTTSGKVAVIAEGRSDVVVERGVGVPGTVVPDAGGEIRLVSDLDGSAEVELRCPIGSHVVIGTASGAVDLRGGFGNVRVNTISGWIRVEQAEVLDLRSVSADVTVGECAARCRLQTRSGQVTVERSRDSDVSTDSGAVRLDETSGDAHVRTASGKVQIGAHGRGGVAVQTLTGAVTVAVPPGTRPAVDLTAETGQPCCECEAGEDCRISISSVSGAIEVVPDRP